MFFLNHYLSHCKAFLYPQVEDFGITALEAMASGRPVIAYSHGGALETIKEGTTGIFFKHQNWASLTHAVLRFQTLNFDPYLIRESVQQFDEENFINKIENFINRL